LKIKSDIFSEYIKNNIKENKIIFLYGSNFGLIDLLYNKAIKLLQIDTNDPFNVCKIDGNEFKANPFILEDNINTFNIFSENKSILLDLSLISLNMNLENVILEAVTKENDNYFLIIKAGNISSQNKLIKYFEKSTGCILTPCYEENISKIENDISIIFKRHKILFTTNFISHLSSVFNTDSLTNKMELEKLDSFLINNKKVTETALLKLIINNEDINLNKIINSCLNGQTRECLFYFEKIYEKTNSNIILIRMFRKHFRTIEKILLSNQRGNSFLEAINVLKPPIFFKEKPVFLSQCRLWSLKKVNLVQKRLIDLELKIKIGLYPEKTLLSQFILSSSVLAKQKIKT